MVLMVVTELSLVARVTMEFGNIKPSRGLFGRMVRPQISGEIEPLVDVNTTDKVKVVPEIQGVDKHVINC